VAGVEGRGKKTTFILRKPLPTLEEKKELLLGRIEAQKQARKRELDHLGHV